MGARGCIILFTNRSSLALRRTSAAASNSA
jgi:hypothetical protein